MLQIQKKVKARHNRRKKSIRRRITGSTERPRISVYRSNKFFYAQAIDDTKHITIKGVKSAPNATVADIMQLGETFGKELNKLKLEKAVYDRSGYRYHGKVAAFAEGLRKANINI